MSFHILEASDKIAVITSNQKYTYKELNAKVDEYPFISEQKELVLILCQNTVEILSAYLAALTQQHTVMLMSSDTNHELLEQIVHEYQPKWIVGNQAFQGYMLNGLIQERIKKLDTLIHTDLAILLSTSGTTGSQKFVRLSYKNIQSNAEAIVEYLKINEYERAMMNLPMSYSYGLSIINSHFQAGASILLTDESIISKSLWSLVKEHQVTSLAGVPYTYQMLQRIGFLKMELPQLKTLTQAGGRLNEKLVKLFAQYADDHDKHLFVMYGQTEASPRMSYIPPKKVLEKSSSIGIAIPGGELSIELETNELVYKGPNVMMGYATSLKDLAKGDEMNGILHTGDTATVDEDGYFTITGRLKRFIKLFGLRINLDDVERKLETSLQTMVACTGTDDKLIVVLEQEQFIEDVKKEIERLYKLHKTAYKVVVLEKIPRFTNGKTDYVTLKELCL